MNNNFFSLLRMQTNYYMGQIVRIIIEHTAVNRGVVGSSPTRGVPIKSLLISLCFLNMRFTLVAFFFSKSRVAK